MRNLVIFGARGAPRRNMNRVTVAGVTVSCGIMDTASPVFDADRSPDHVLVRVQSVSCNYRDRAFFHSMRRFPSHRFTAVGSEFAGEVIRVGAAVDGLAPGDRVVGNGHYTGWLLDENGVREGVVTNQASKEYLVVPAGKLSRVPTSMSVEEAGAFGLNIQTAYSMVRRAAPEPGDHVLVMSATSNTSLAVLQALRSTGSHVYAATTRTDRDRELEALGAQIIHVPRTLQKAALDLAARELRGFTHALDPFLDINAKSAVENLRPAGTYVTCGFLAQNPHSASDPSLGAGVSAKDVLFPAILKNLTLIGNCIGLTRDLQAALDDFERGTIGVAVDSVWSGHQVKGFLDRTFNDAQRFGKTVYRYTQ